jgi:hypothetical protein
MCSSANREGMVGSSSITPLIHNLCTSWEGGVACFTLQMLSCCGKSPQYRRLGGGPEARPA